MKLLVIFILIPLIELYFLIEVGSAVGALSMVLWIVLGALAGILLMRHQGLMTMQQAQVAMAKGESVDTALMEGVFIFLGGLLLFLPGLITDAIGILFLLPFVRQALIRQAVKGMAQRHHSQRGHRGPQVFEGEWQPAETKAPKSIEERSSSLSDSKNDKVSEG